ncbi:TPA: hypothetical protein ACKRKK_003645 [Proteus mirabilis]|uniref:hypothetical protein n=2 Tax=Proteus mirabilis TaxID=584 RepID=UPI000A768A23|nr:hypothetical protein [Proteus mirabilis]MBG2785803.1 hypothetical protein [Proteus mirabilis]MCL8560058.1 hypothetical protein [Proteus mirabilis]MDM3554749.1 hypothetical protein [Proteus mirabilis]NJJ95364.1 hypothetical protein [Proteus mirabilis]HCD1099528.1 hypothetical protein [Proteus mirabilis]
MMKINESELALEYLRRSKEELTPEEFFDKYLSLMESFKKAIESKEPKATNAFDVLF